MAFGKPPLNRESAGFLALELETGANQFLVDARVEFSYQSEVLCRMPNVEASIPSAPHPCPALKPRQQSPGSLLYVLYNAYLVHVGDAMCFVYSLPCETHIAHIAHIARSETEGLAGCTPYAPHFAWFVHGFDMTLQRQVCNELYKITERTHPPHPRAKCCTLKFFEFKHCFHKRVCL